MEEPKGLIATLLKRQKKVVQNRPPSGKKSKEELAKECSEMQAAWERDEATKQSHEEERRRHAEQERILWEIMTPQERKEKELKVALKRFESLRDEAARAAKGRIPISKQHQVVIRSTPCGPPPNPMSLVDAVMHRRKLREMLPPEQQTEPAYKQEEYLRIINEGELAQLGVHLLTSKANVEGILHARHDDDRKMILEELADWSRTYVSQEEPATIETVGDLAEGLRAIEIDDEHGECENVENLLDNALADYSERVERAKGVADGLQAILGNMTDLHRHQQNEVHPLIHMGINTELSFPPDDHITMGSHHEGAGHSNASCDKQRACKPKPLSAVEENASGPVSSNARPLSPVSENECLSQPLMDWLVHSEAGLDRLYQLSTGSPTGLLRRQDPSFHQHVLKAKDDRMSLQRMREEQTQTKLRHIIVKLRGELLMVHSEVEELKALRNGPDMGLGFTEEARTTVEAEPTSPVMIQSLLGKMKAEMETMHQRDTLLLNQARDDLSKLKVKYQELCDELIEADKERFRLRAENEELKLKLHLMNDSLESRDLTLRDNEMQARLALQKMEVFGRDEEWYQATIANLEHRLQAAELDLEGRVPRAELDDHMEEIHAQYRTDMHNLSTQVKCLKAEVGELRTANGILTNQLKTEVVPMEMHSKGIATLLTIAQKQKDTLSRMRSCIRRMTPALDICLFELCGLGLRLLMTQLDDCPTLKVEPFASQVLSLIKALEEEAAWSYTPSAPAVAAPTTPVTLAQLQSAKWGNGGDDSSSHHFSMTDGVPDDGDGTAEPEVHDTACQTEECEVPTHQDATEVEMDEVGTQTDACMAEHEMPDAPSEGGPDATAVQQFLHIFTQYLKRLLNTATSRGRNTLDDNCPTFPFCQAEVANLRNVFVQAVCRMRQLHVRSQAIQNTFLQSLKEEVGALVECNSGTSKSIQSLLACMRHLRSLAPLSDEFRHQWFRLCWQYAVTEATVGGSLRSSTLGQRAQGLPTEIMVSQRHAIRVARQWQSMADALHLDVLQVLESQVERLNPLTSAQVAGVAGNGFDTKHLAQKPKQVEVPSTSGGNPLPAKCNTRRENRSENLQKKSSERVLSLSPPDAKHRLLGKTGRVVSMRFPNAASAGTSKDMPVIRKVDCATMTNFFEDHQVRIAELEVALAECEEQLRDWQVLSDKWIRKRDKATFTHDHRIASAVPLSAVAAACAVLAVERQCEPGGCSKVSVGVCTTDISFTSLEPLQHDCAATQGLPKELRCAADSTPPEASSKPPSLPPQITELLVAVQQALGNTPMSPDPNAHLHEVLQNIVTWLGGHSPKKARSDGEADILRTANSKVNIDTMKMKTLGPPRSHSPPPITQQPSPPPPLAELLPLHGHSIGGDLGAKPALNLLPKGPHPSDLWQNPMAGPPLFWQSYATPEVAMPPKPSNVPEQPRCDLPSLSRPSTALSRPSTATACRAGMARRPSSGPPMLSAIRPTSASQHPQRNLSGRALPKVNAHLTCHHIFLPLPSPASPTAEDIVKSFTKDLDQTNAPTSYIP